MRTLIHGYQHDAPASTTHSTTDPIPSSPPIISRPPLLDHLLQSCLHHTMRHVRQAIQLLGIGASNAFGGGSSGNAKPGATAQGPASLRMLGVLDVLLELGLILVLPLPHEILHPCVFQGHLAGIACGDVPYDGMHDWKAKRAPTLRFKLIKFPFHASIIFILL